VVLGPNDQRTLHARAGASTPSAGWRGGLGVGAVLEVRSDDVDGFKTITGPGGSALLAPNGDPYETGFDKLDVFGRVRLATRPEAAVFQSLTLTAGQTDEVSDETYLGLAAADFEATPYARYAGSRYDRMDADHEALRARHVAVFSDRLDLTTTLYRNVFARNWYKLDKVSAGGGSVGVASILDDPETYAGELVAVRGEGAGSLYVKANNRSYLSRGVQTVAGLRLGTPARGALVEAGLRVHADEMDRFQWVDEYAAAAGQTVLVAEGTPGTDSNRIESAEAVAGFVQADIQLGALALTPGARFESVRLRREDFGTADPERTGADLSVRENTVSALIPGLGAAVHRSDVLLPFDRLDGEELGHHSGADGLDEGRVGLESGQRGSQIVRRVLLGAGGLEAVAGLGIGALEAGFHAEAGCCQDGGYRRVDRGGTVGHPILQTG